MIYFQAIMDILGDLALVAWAIIIAISKIKR